MNKEEMENRLKGVCQDCMWLEKIEPIFNQLQQENKQLKEEIKDLKRICELFSNSLWSGDLKRAKERIDKAIEYLEYNNEGLYTFEPDYDYEENIVDNYEPSSYREDLLGILKGDK